LILAKEILENILVYWLSIMHVPNGILGKNRKKKLQLPLSGEEANRGDPTCEMVKIRKAKSVDIMVAARGIHLHV